MQRIKLLNSGQTLVMLLVFMAIAVVITSAAVIVTIVNSTSTGQFSSGESALDVAESGAENALLRLLRDPNYSGETIMVGLGTATATVSGNNVAPVVVSQGVIGGFSRKIQVTTSYNSNVLSILSWKEIF